MLIAQSLTEYGVVSSMIDATYILRVRVEELLGPPGFLWVAVAVVIVVAVILIRR